MVVRDVASTGRGLFEGAIRGGAQALGQGVSGIAGGACADALLDSFIFAGGRSIDGVWRAGRKVVVEGVHIARQTIARHFAAAVERLLAGS